MEWKLVCTATPNMLSLPASQSQNSNTNHSMLVTPGKKSSGDDLRALAIGAQKSESLTGGSGSMAVMDCRNHAFMRLDIADVSMLFPGKNYKPWKTDKQQQASCFHVHGKVVWTTSLNWWPDEASRRFLEWNMMRVSDFHLKLNKEAACQLL